MDESVLTPQLLTVEQMAQLLHITPHTLRLHIRNRTAPPYLQTGHGHRILFPLAAFDRWVAAQLQEPVAS
jgi:excisionase family DNA binding protein